MPDSDPVLDSLLRWAREQELNANQLASLLDSARRALPARVDSNERTHIHNAPVRRRDEAPEPDSSDAETGSLPVVSAPVQFTEADTGVGMVPVTGEVDATRVFEADGESMGVPVADQPRKPAPMLELGKRARRAVASTRDGGPQSLVNLDHESIPSRRSDLGNAHRYEDRGLLGVGGMGEVRRVFDRDLRRAVAMKILRKELIGRDRSVARFLEEAQIGGQLEHPALLPVHELGRLDDGRFFFTMREVRGLSLTTVIAAVHGASTETRWGTTESGWSLERLLVAFTRVCEAVGYAHRRGVIHRDLKPSNIMVERNQEALVVDWGIAKVVGHPDRLVPELNTFRSEDDTFETRAGATPGTPMYMPPEQAAGMLSEVSYHSDVYSLGAVLYQILCGEPPFDGEDATVILERVVQEAPAPLRHRTALPLPPEVVRICDKAMQREPEDRFANADAFARAMQAYLDGTKKREKARALVERAAELEFEAKRDRLAASEARERGDQMLESIPRWQDEEAKAPAWELQDRAEQLELAASLTDVRAESLLHSALSYAADFPDAHKALARRYMVRHYEAEQANDERAAAAARSRLLEQVRAMPANSADRQTYERYLQGTTFLSLDTLPSRATATLYRYVRERRRLRPQRVAELLTPVESYQLEPGSYLLKVSVPGYHTVHYPVHVGRQDPWTSVPPDGQTPEPIRLLELGALRDDEVYVPAGWFRSGGHARSLQVAERELRWVDSFIVRTYPITNQQYIAFLDDLIAQGREEEALRLAPRERSGSADGMGSLIFGRRPDGGFELRPDGDGDMWEPDAPVSMVDVRCAFAYAAWMRRRTGEPWGLLNEWAWEKAARGVDGREFPWGDFLDPSWCVMRESHEGRALPRSVFSCPVDESPYGVRGMGGNMLDWTGSVYRESPDAPARIVPVVTQPPEFESTTAFSVRGGGWPQSASVCRAAVRSRTDAGNRNEMISIRIARSL